MESPEDMAQLRQVVRKAHQLPEPDWNLFARTTKRWSRAAELIPSMIAQQKSQEKESKKEKKDDKASQRREE